MPPVVVVLTNIPRYATVPLALFQSYGYVLALESGALGDVVDTPGAAFRITAMISMLGGSVFLMWLGRANYRARIGNGISLLIFASIITSLPLALGQLFDGVRVGTYSPFFVVAILLGSAALLAGVVFMERGQRRVLINYAKRQVGNRLDGRSGVYLPLKVNMAGVMPAIFCLRHRNLSATLLLFASAGGSNWLRDISAYLQRGTPLYFLTLTATIVFFYFFLRFFGL